MTILHRAPSREELIATFEAEAAQSDREICALRAELETANARTEAARKAWREASANSLEIQQRIDALRFQADSRRDAFERRMRDLVPTEVRDLLAWIDRERDGLRSKYWVSDGFTGETSSSGRPVRCMTSNAAAIARVMDALMQARTRAMALMFAPHEHIEKAVQEIRRSVPSVEQAEAELRVSA